MAKRKCHDEGIRLFISKNINGIRKKELKQLIRFLKKYSNGNKVMGMFVYGGYIVFSLLYAGLFYFLWLVIPKRNEKVVFCNMKGVRYGDNPMYISEALHKKRKQYEIVWLLDEGVIADIPDYVIRKKYGFIRNAIELAGSKAWVDSNTKDAGIKKRKDQLFVQTWHGSYGIKKVALDRKGALTPLDKVIFYHNARLADVMVSNSIRTTEIYRNAFAFEKKVLNIGSPRNDVFLGNRTHQIYMEVRRSFGLDSSARVVMYAPTYRENYNMDFWDIELDKVLNTFSERDGQNWYAFVRLHPQNLKESAYIKNERNIINVSGYSVMQDLLVAADALITDYSSCMFDFITNPKPCFIYAPDLEQYENDRGNYYKMSELPFPLARNNSELLMKIKQFNEKEYVDRVLELHNRVGLCETGNASEQVADYIIEFIENGRK